MLSPTDAHTPIACARSFRSVMTLTTIASATRLSIEPPGPCTTPHESPQGLTGSRRVAESFHGHGSPSDGESKYDPAAGRRPAIRPLEVKIELVVVRGPVAEEPIKGIDASAVPGLNESAAPFRRATPTLTRWIKQAISEWYVLDMLELSWGGTKAHTNQGFNIGKPPYGYELPPVAGHPRFGVQRL